QRNFQSESPRGGFDLADPRPGARTLPAPATLANASRAVSRSAAGIRRTALPGTRRGHLPIPTPDREVERQRETAGLSASPWSWSRDSAACWNLVGVQHGVCGAHDSVRAVLALSGCASAVPAGSGCSAAVDSPRGGCLRRRLPIGARLTIADLEFSTSVPDKTSSLRCAAVSGCGLRVTQKFSA